MSEESTGPEHFCPYLRSAFRNVLSCTYKRSSGSVLHKGTHEWTRTSLNNTDAFFQLCLFLGFLVFLLHSCFCSPLRHYAEKAGLAFFFSLSAARSEVFLLESHQTCFRLKSGLESASSLAKSKSPSIQWSSSQGLSLPLSYKYNTTFPSILLRCGA